MDIFIKIFLVLIGNLTFLYLFWSRLKEDYTSEAIFTNAFLVIFSFVLGEVVLMRFPTNYWFWVLLIFIFLGFVIGIYRSKFKFMESLEALIISLLPSYSFYFLYQFIKQKSLEAISGFIIISLLIILFYIFERHYKRFSWYKSGRIGFSGLSAGAILFFTRALVFVFYESMLSFSGKYEIYLSAIVAFILFLSVYNLARS